MHCHALQCIGAAKGNPGKVEQGEGHSRGEGGLPACLPAWLHHKVKGRGDEDMNGGRCDFQAEWSEPILMVFQMQCNPLYTEISHWITYSFNVPNYTIHSETFSMVIQLH